MIQISQKAGSQRNVTFHIHGSFSDVALKDQCTSIKLPQEKLKLTSLVWLIEEKMGLHLMKVPGEVWMPLESRNNLRFDQGIIIEGNELWLDPFKTETTIRESFFLIMDFDK